MAPSILLISAGVAEWHTRTTQNRMRQLMRVQVPPPAQNKTCPIGAGFKNAFLGLQENIISSCRLSSLSWPSSWSSWPFSLLSFSLPFSFNDLILDLLRRDQITPYCYYIRNDKLKTVDKSKMPKKFYKNAPAEKLRRICMREIN